MKPRRLSVFLPAWNEADNLVRVITEVRSEIERLDLDEFEVIVVDDGSTDRTVEVVTGLQVVDPHLRLVRHERNLGYGAALRSGFAAARLDHVFFTDADGQFEIADLGAFLQAAEEADVVIGYRADRQDHVVRRISGRLWSAVVNVLLGLEVRDVDCAFKLLRREDVERLGPLGSSGAVFSSELLWKLHRSGRSIRQLPVRHRPRVAGEPSGGSPAVILRAVRELVRLRFGRSRRWHAAHAPDVTHASDPAGGPGTPTR